METYDTAVFVVWGKNSSETTCRLVKKTFLYLKTTSFKLKILPNFVIQNIILKHEILFKWHTFSNFPKIISKRLAGENSCAKN